MEYRERAYIMIRTQTDKLESTWIALSKLKGVRYADMVYGPYDLICVIEAKSREDLNRIVVREIRLLSGVIDTVTYLRIDVGDQGMERQ